MRIDADTLIARVVDLDPTGAAAVLAWYGIQLVESDGDRSLAALCADRGVDLDDVLVDLHARLAGSSAL